MIQRIQSVYLFFAALILGLTFFFPIAEFIGVKDSLVLYIYKVVSLVPGSSNVYDLMFVMPLLAIISVVILFSLGTIFMYKNRMGQMKIIRFLMFLLVAFIGVLFLYYYDILEQASAAVVDWKDIQPAAFAPIGSFLFLYLALLGVKKDEKLIRSADRLR